MHIFIQLLAFILYALKGPGKASYIHILQRSPPHVDEKLATGRARDAQQGSTRLPHQVCKVAMENPLLVLKQFLTVREAVCTAWTHSPLTAKDTDMVKNVQRPLGGVLGPRQDLRGVLHTRRVTPTFAMRCVLLAISLLSMKRVRMLPEALECPVAGGEGGAVEIHRRSGHVVAQMREGDAKKAKNRSDWATSFSIDRHNVKFSAKRSLAAQQGI